MDCIPVCAENDPFFGKGTSADGFGKKCGIFVGYIWIFRNISVKISLVWESLFEIGKNVPISDWNWVRLLIC